MARLGITGHRPQKLGKGWNDYQFHRKVKQAIQDKITTIGPDVVITGMALGVDQWTAEIAIQLGLPFVAALPFKLQDNAWSPKLREHYAWLLSKAAKTVLVDRQPGYISDKAPPDIYSREKMWNRNIWIIHQLKEGDVLLGVCQDSNSGTWHCLSTARTYSEKLEIQVLRPNRMKWYNYQQYLDDELPF